MALLHRHLISMTSAVFFLFLLTLALVTVYGGHEEFELITRFESGNNAPPSTLPSKKNNPAPVRVNEKKEREKNIKKKTKEEQNKRDNEREQASKRSSTKSGTISFQPASSSAHSFSGSAWDYLMTEMKRLNVQFKDPRSIYSFEEKDHSSLGYGLYGRVFKATKDSKTYAIKRIPVAHSLRILGYSINEYDLAKILHHPLIIPTYEAFYNDDTFWLVMDLFPSAVLMEEVPDSAWNERAVRNVVYQILSALRYLIKSGICHSDFDESNVMLTFDIEEYDNNHKQVDSNWGKVRLIDFGLGKRYLPSDSETRHQIHSLDEYKYCHEGCNDNSRFLTFAKGLVARSQNPSEASLEKLLSLLSSINSHSTDHDIASIQENSVFDSVRQLQKVPF